MSGYNDSIWYGTSEAVRCRFLLAITFFFRSCLQSTDPSLHHQYLSCCCVLFHLYVVPPNGAHPPLVAQPAMALFPLPFCPEGFILRSHRKFSVTVDLSASQAIATRSTAPLAMAARPLCRLTARLGDQYALDVGLVQVNTSGFSSAVVNQRQLHVTIIR
jgi:hypothetical protein